MWLPCSKPSRLPMADALEHTCPVHTHPEVKGAYYGFLLEGLYFGTLGQKYRVNSLRHGLHCDPRPSQRIRIWSLTGVTTGRTQPLLALSHLLIPPTSVSWDHSKEPWDLTLGSGSPCRKIGLLILAYKALLLPGPFCQLHSPCPSQHHPHQPPGCLSNTSALSSYLAFEPQVSFPQNVLPSDS